MRTTNYLMLLSSLFLFSCFKCSTSKEQENIFNNDFAHVDTTTQSFSKKQENIFNELLKDKFFQTYLDEGKINFSVHYYPNEGFCHGLQNEIICTAEKINKERKYIELTEFLEVKDKIRIQIECHLPNNYVDKIYSCSYVKSSGGYKLKSKYID